MQYKVPQNIDIEDKVIAGLTLRQFMFLMIAGGFILILKYLLPPTLQFMFFPVALIIGIAGALLAFIKINERPLEIFLVSAAKAVVTPPQRIWQKEINVTEKHPQKPLTKKEFVPKKDLNEIRGKLDSLALIVDSGGGANLINKGRATNIRPKETNTPTRTQDILAKAEEPSETLSFIIEKARKKVSKEGTEGPISAMATTNPEVDKKYLERETISVTSEKQVEQMLREIKAEQKEKELKLETAKIKKFSDKG